MIRHQAIRVHLPVTLRACFSEGFDPKLPVCISVHDRLAMIAPAHHMINRAGIFDSDLAGLLYCLSSLELSVNLKD